jgi:hypothetical protein
MASTIETPGMVRWNSNSNRHYFIKWMDIGTSKYTTLRPRKFVLGTEQPAAGGKLEYLTGIQFDASEAVELIDRLASFNGMPSYTAQLQRWELIEHLLDSMEESKLHSKADLIKKIREILKVTK